MRLFRRGPHPRPRPRHSLIPINLDVTDPEQIDSAYDAISSYLSVSNMSLYALINVAGGAVCAPLESIPLRDYRHQLDVELVGRHEMARVFMPLLRQGMGRVINLGSVGGRAFVAGFGAYHVAKAGLAAETSVLRMEVARFGVGVSLIEPGGFSSESPSVCPVTTQI